LKFVQFGVKLKEEFQAEQAIERSL
jgi:hypothetical protein